MTTGAINSSMNGVGVTNHSVIGPKACSMTWNPVMLPTMLEGPGTSGHLKE